MYLPLGRSCRISLRLRDLGLKSSAYPFDWSLTPASAINMFLRSDLSAWPCHKDIIPCDSIRRIYVLDGLDDCDRISHYSNLNARTEIQQGTLVRPIICSKAGILFPHEPFYESLEESVQAFESRYSRRASRLRAAIHSNGVIGVRDEEIEPNAFQKSYLDRYLGNGACDELFGAHAERLDRTLIESVFEGIINYDSLI